MKKTRTYPRQKYMLVNIFTLLTILFTSSIFAQNYTYTVPVNTGWNLIGNGTNSNISVTANFNNSSKITSVWKWNSITSTWAFYAPGQIDGGAVYAKMQGYDFLTNINSGEGYWVNAKSAFTLSLPSVSSLSLTNFKQGGSNFLKSGWNLIAIGDAVTISQFNVEIGPVQSSSIPNNLTSIWTWDNVNSKWYFYSPLLNSNGQLISYINNQGYQSFTNLLNSGVGFWVNYSPTVTSNISSVTPISGSTLITSSLNLALAGSNNNIVDVYAVADLNNDGLQDVIMSGFAEPPNAQGSALVAMHIFYQNADGSMTDKTSQVISNNAIEGAGTGIKTADIDGDGYIDIFIPPGQDGVWSHPVIFWGGSSGFSRQDFSNYGLMGGCLADFNNDNKLDVFINTLQNSNGSKNISDSNNGIFLNTGSRIFSTPQSSNIGYGGNDCATIKVGSNTAVYTTNVWGQSDKISLMDSNLNQVGQSVSTLSDSGSDGSYSIYVTAIPSLYGTGLLDFFVNQDQNLGPVDGPGPKTIFMNNGDGTFTNKGTIFTTNSGCCGEVVPLRINNQPAVLINGIDGTASIFSGTNQYSTANTFKDLISGGSSTVYQNLNNGNIFIFEHKGSSIFVKPFVK